MNTKKFMGDYLLAGMYGEERTLTEIPYNEVTSLPKGHGRKNMLRLAKIESLLSKGDPKSILDCCEYLQIINGKVNYLVLSSPKYPRRIEQLISFGIFPTVARSFMYLYRYKLPVPHVYNREDGVPERASKLTPLEARETEDYIRAVMCSDLSPYALREFWARFIKSYPLVKYIDDNKDLFGPGKATGCYLTEQEITLHEKVGATIDTCCHILRSLAYFRSYDGYALATDKTFMQFIFETLTDDRHFACAAYALEEIICCANEYTCFDLNDIIGKRFVEIVDSFGPCKFAAFSRILIQLAYDNEAFTEPKKKGYDVLDRSKRDREYRAIDINHALILSVPNFFEKINTLLLSCKCIYGKSTKQLHEQLLLHLCLFF